MGDKAINLSMGYKYILSDGKSYLYFILYIKIGNPIPRAYMDISAHGDISYIAYYVRNSFPENFHTTSIPGLDLTSSI